MPKFIDLTGQRFGLLVVLSQAEYTPNDHRIAWLCRCDCGTVKTVRAHDLRSGATVSCGCYSAKNARERHMKHGDTISADGKMDRLYITWANMKARCSRPSSTHYQYYGGRGVTVCDEWFNSYETFKLWAYANGYNPKAPSKYCTIDRIDVNGNYEPSNCRWISLKTQNFNRRSNHMLEYCGEKKTLTEWESACGIPRRTISDRLNAGWDVRRALTTKVKENRRTNQNGEREKFPD